VGFICGSRVFLLSSAEAGINMPPLMLLNNLNGTIFSRTPALASDTSTRENHPFPYVQPNRIPMTLQGSTL